MFWVNLRSFLQQLFTDNKNQHYEYNKRVLFNRAPVAQFVERRAVMREVVSSTPVGPTLRVLK